MDDKELADKVVALGLGHVFDKAETPHHYVVDVPGPISRANEFVRDWRVAGAVIERCIGKPNWFDIAINRKCRSEPDNVARCWISPQGPIELDTVTAHARNESLPRTIIEAGVEALRQN